jgi:DNA repair protein RadC
MRERFFEAGGFDGFSPHEVIEFLLFFTIPRINTNETAHYLLHKFGSIAELFDASREELKASGLSDSTITLFKTIPECFNQYYQSRNVSRVYDSPKKLIELFEHAYPGNNSEEFRLACFTPHLNLKNGRVYIINEGAPTTTEVNMRKLVETIIKTGTNSVAISHSHPNLPPTPSKQDIAATRYIMQTLRAIGVHMLDHIIVGKNGSYSMRENDVFSIFEN